MPLATAVATRAVTVQDRAAFAHDPEVVRPTCPNRGQIARLTAVCGVTLSPPGSPFPRTLPPQALSPHAKKAKPAERSEFRKGFIFMTRMVATKPGPGTTPL